jgi:hypothetical protein
MVLWRQCDERGSSACGGRISNLAGAEERQYIEPVCRETAAWGSVVIHAQMQREARKAFPERGHQRGQREWSDGRDYPALAGRELANRPPLRR